MYQYFPVADVNTCVLTDDDLEMLEGLRDGLHDGQLQIVFYGEYGWFISIQDETSEFEEMLGWARGYGLSDEFELLMRSLRAYGFHYVRLDTDGLTTEIQDPPATMWEHMEVDRIRRAGNHG